MNNYVYRLFLFVDEIWLAYFAKDDRYRNGYIEQFLRDGVRDVNLGHMDDPVRHVFPSEFIFLYFIMLFINNRGINYNELF